MGLLSLFRKNQQVSDRDTGGSASPGEEAAAPARVRNRRKQPAEPRARSDGQRIDPVLPEKKRARRRLVGAVALVVGLIVVLPMVLDAEPKPLADDIAVQMPSKDARQAQGPGNRPLPTPGDTLAPAIEPGEEIIELPDVRREALHAKAASEPEQGAENARAQSRPATGGDRGVARTAAERDRGAADLAKSGGGAESEPRKIATAAADGKRDGSGSREAEDKPQKIVIQVAALSSAGKASELQEKLASAGVRSYTQKVATESGQRIRIRTGPYGSKEEAEKVRAKLVSLGLHGTVVPN